MTVTGQEVVQDIETVSGTGLYSAVTNKVNHSSLFSLFFLHPIHRPLSFCLSLSVFPLSLTFTILSSLSTTSLPTLPVSPPPLYHSLKSVDKASLIH
jgi:hypothetical protein